MATPNEPMPFFAIRDGYALYRGPVAGAGPVHRHAAFQIAIAIRGQLAMVDSSGVRHEATTLVVSPMTPHRISAVTELLTYFVEPQCVFADRLRAHHVAGIAPAPELNNLEERDIGPSGGGPSAELDPRVLAALSALRDGSVPLSGLAGSLGVSPQRLRGLARRDLGMPLARWRVWSRLRIAAEELQAGRSPAEAAATAGFADQAHFTRQLREMMGVTPAAVLPMVRGQFLRAR